MKISIVGAGYVGLVAAACFAEKGHEVVCVDVDESKVKKISQGVAYVFEEGLEALLQKNWHRINATSDFAQSICNTDVSFITVGTPFSGCEIDLTYVGNACKQIGSALRSKSGYHVIVVKSTVVPGTTDEVVLPLLERFSGRKAGIDFGVAVNPEFLREGEAVQDFLHPDRVVVGGIGGRVIDIVAGLYRNFDDAVEIVKTTNKTAEMIKYASNSLFASLISFSNEIGNLCSVVGDIDIVDVMKGVHLDHRLSPMAPGGERTFPKVLDYIKAGCGYGGSCFPKDLKALIACSKKFDQPMPLLEAVVRVNETQPLRVLSLLKKEIDPLNGARIAILGLAFKPGTDDVRESPAIPIINGLLAEKAQVVAYDPIATKTARTFFDDRSIAFCADLSATLHKAEAVVLLTGWQEFRKIPELLRGAEKQPLVIDGRRFLDKESVARYAGIGLS
jgi:UDPglucose 6-dehydrogenase/GDP-mannose 6-dehydrogenase